MPVSFPPYDTPQPPFRAMEALEYLKFLFESQIVSGQTNNVDLTFKLRDGKTIFRFFLKRTVINVQNHI